MDYHTALHPPRLGPPRFRSVKPQGVAFLWDVCDPAVLPAEYAECDVFYTDLPWRDGFAEFERRAGMPAGRRYAAFLAAVNALTTQICRPLVYVTGRHALRLLLSPTAVHPTRLNGAPAVAVTYGAVECSDWSDATTILASLCARYRCIGDFCCGNGRTAAAAVAAGKRFVVSDYNMRCIGYIHENLLATQRA